MIPIGPVMARTRIAADRPTLWKWVVDPHLREKWLPGIRLDERLEGQITLDGDHAPHEQDLSGAIDVWVSGHAVGWHWSEADESATSPLVTLRPGLEDTTIAITETGFDALEDGADRASAAQEFWQEALNLLRNVLDEKGTVPGAGAEGTQSAESPESGSGVGESAGEQAEEAATAQESDDEARDTRDSDVESSGADSDADGALGVGGENISAGGENASVEFAEDSADGDDTRVSDGEDGDDGAIDVDRADDAFDLGGADSAADADDDTENDTVEVSLGGSDKGVRDVTPEADTEGEAETDLKDGVEVELEGETQDEAETEAEVENEGEAEAEGEVEADEPVETSNECQTAGPESASSGVLTDGAAAALVDDEANDTVPVQGGNVACVETDDDEVESAQADTHDDETAETETVLSSQDTEEGVTARADNPVSETDAEPGTDPETANDAEAANDAEVANDAEATHDTEAAANAESEDSVETADDAEPGGSVETADDIEVADDVETSAENNRAGSETVQESAVPADSSSLQNEPARVEDSSGVNESVDAVVLPEPPADWRDRRDPSITETVVMPRADHGDGQTDSEEIDFHRLLRETEIAQEEEEIQERPRRPWWRRRGR